MCIKVNGETSENSGIQRGVKQGCVMSLWLINLYMVSVIRDMKTNIGNVRVELSKSW